jgi:SAM-dependent methyltransferase
MKISGGYFRTNWILNNLFIKNQLFVFSVKYGDEFRILYSRRKGVIDHAQKLERSLLKETTDKFTFKGFCWVCRNHVDFLIDYKFSYLKNGVPLPNFRERLICPGCNLNARKRAAFHFLSTKINHPKDASIYITEQKTHLFNVLQKKYPSIIGSEFLGHSALALNASDRGIRNEDLTRLTFKDETLDTILSFDCFEHIFEYKKAFQECFRCLRKNGELLFSIPFNPYQDANILRAYVDDNGNIVHLLPEEWHGEPLKGFFCFHNFGWQLIDDIKAAGFARVEVIFYWSWKYGYLGGFKPLFIATKASQNKNRQITLEEYNC